VVLQQQYKNPIVSFIPWAFIYIMTDVWTHVLKLKPFTLREHVSVGLMTLGGIILVSCIDWSAMDCFTNTSNPFSFWHFLSSILAVVLLSFTLVKEQ